MLNIYYFSSAELVFFLRISSESVEINDNFLFSLISNPKILKIQFFLNKIHCYDYLELFFSDISE